MNLRPFFQLINHFRVHAVGDYLEVSPPLLDGVSIEVNAAIKYGVKEPGCNTKSYTTEENPVTEHRTVKEDYARSKKIPLPKVTPPKNAVMPKVVLSKLVKSPKVAKSNLASLPNTALAKWA
jgi:hypothetical protein